MVVYIISDTHIPDRMPVLPEQFLEKLTGEDIVLHAGDFTVWQVLDDLKKRTTVYGVWGNMDLPQIKNTLPRKTIVLLSGFKIGIYHGAGPPFGLVERVRKEFSEPVDMIIFGHSHIPFSKKFGATLVFNPGSLSFNVDREPSTYGILHIENKNLWAEIVEI